MRGGANMLAIVRVKLAADVKPVGAPVVRRLPQQHPRQRPERASRLARHDSRGGVGAAGERHEVYIVVPGERAASVSHHSEPRSHSAEITSSASMATKWVAFSLRPGKELSMH